MRHPEAVPQRVHPVTRVVSALGLLLPPGWIAVFALASRDAVVTPSETLVLLTVLPFVAWAGHFCAIACVSGRFPALPYWPFASYRVLVADLALLPILLRTAHR